MSAGFPTDDPWGDRQQGLDLAAFSELLRGGPSFAWAPGTDVRVLEPRLRDPRPGHHERHRPRVSGRGPGAGASAAGNDCHDVLPSRTFLASASPSAMSAAMTPSLDEPMDRYGALASMGGVFTSVHDLARWVAGFADAFPPRDDPEEGHPLRRASRREMQQIHATRSRHASNGRRPMLPRPSRPEATASDCSQRRHAHRSDGRAWWRLSRVRVAHALASGVRHRRDRARERPLRADSRRM